MRTVGRRIRRLLEVTVPVVMLDQVSKGLARVSLTPGEVHGILPFANLRLGFAADQREYGIGSQILADLGLTTIRVLTNNPKKISGISGFGLEVVEQVPIETAPNAENRRYLDVKRDKLGHSLHHQDLRFDPELFDGAEA